MWYAKQPVGFSFEFYPLGDSLPISAAAAAIERLSGHHEQSVK